MTNFPSFSKKIYTGALVKQRMQFDDQLFGDGDTTLSVFGSIDTLDENTVRNFVYRDFYERTKSEKNRFSVYIGPHTPHIQINYNNYTSSFLTDYAVDIEQYQSLFTRLGIVCRLETLYSAATLSVLQQGKTQLLNEHRLGLRSDIAFYDIESGTMIPEHRIKTMNKKMQEYHIKCFIGSNKETVPCIINEIYDIFGAVALLVHPNDKRYKRARFKKEIILPITNRIIPVIPYENMPITGYGTRLLIPGHNRDDLQLATKLGLDTSITIYDRFGTISKYGGAEFESKSIIDFYQNIVNFLQDIANLDQIVDTEVPLYYDTITKLRVYPLIEKNAYIGLGYFSPDDDFISVDSRFVGSTDNLLHDLYTEEGFCVTNRDVFQPVFIDDSVNETLQDIQNTHIIEDIVKDFYALGLLHFPAKGDDLIELFSLQFHNKLLWELLYELRISSNEHQYAHLDDNYSLLQRLSQDVPDEGDITQFLEIIDLGGYFVHTKYGYISNTIDNYHFDNDYIHLLLLSFNKKYNVIESIHSESDTKFLKYLSYLYYFLNREVINLHVYALEDKVSFGKSWETIENLFPDVVRVALLQDSHHAGHDDIEKRYTIEEFDRFIHKWRNLCRVVPLWNGVHSLQDMSQALQGALPDMNDYDKYLITTLHKLYTDVQFALSKHQTDAIVSQIISVLWTELSDILLYVLHYKSSDVSEKVVSYVIAFANHLLYPLLPTLITSLFAYRELEYMSTFFEEDVTFSVDKNVKCDFLLQFITTRYNVLQNDYNVEGFVLQANKDFIDYAKQVIPDFYDFLGKEYTIQYLDEYTQWPEDLPGHKVFAMQWGVLYSDNADSAEGEMILEDSLVSLQKQLLYNQQMLQSINSILIRAHSQSDTDSIDQLQGQKKELVERIEQIEFNISKLKYFN